MLGQGDYAIEAIFAGPRRAIAGAWPYRSAMTRRRRISSRAAADAIIQPSRFEPCGLTQLYALRYGCVPVVSRDGGLSETDRRCQRCRPLRRVATGFQFHPVERAGLDAALGRAVGLHANRAVWTRMQKRGMKTDVSWTVSAGRYAALYRSLLNGKAS